MKQLITLSHIQYNLYKSIGDTIIYQFKQNNGYYLNYFSISEKMIIWQTYFDYYFDSINIIDDVIVLRKFNGSVILLDLNFGNKTLKNTNLEEFESEHLLPISKKKEIVIYKDKEGVFLSGVFDLGKNEIKWLNGSIIGLTQLNGIYFGIKDRQLLSKYDSNLGYLQWQSDLSPYKWYQFDGPKPAQIHQIVGISENILLVWMAGEQLLGLDVVTGKVFWKIDFAPYFRITKWFTGSYYWNIQNHKLYLLKYLYYFEIDLATQEVKILWQNPEESYSITHCCYTDEYVYFVASGSELGIEILGTFNRLSLTIEWLESLTMPRLDSYSYVSFHQAPQVDGDRLYVLDSGGTLHIFEKQSSIQNLI